MRLICNIKRILIACLLFQLIGLSGCSKQRESITLGEWLSILNEKAGIVSYHEDIPYYLNISESSECFADVQAAVEWEVLDTSYSFQPENLLTKEWVAYTLMNLSGKDVDSNIEIQDISKTQFPNHIKAAVASGLMTLDNRNSFHPKELMDKEDAIPLLDVIVSYINNREITKAENDISWDEIDMTSIHPETYDSAYTSVKVSKEEGSDLIPGINVSFLDDQGFGIVREVEAIEETEDGTILHLKEFDDWESLPDMNISGSEELNFDNAEIITEDGMVQEMANVMWEDTVGNYLTHMSVSSLQKTFSVGNFSVTIKQNGSTLSAEAYREFPHGTKAYAKVKVNGVKVDYQWKKDEQELRDAYFKVKYTTEEDFGVSNGAYKNLYGDFSKVKASDFIGSLQSMFLQKKDVIEDTLTICTVRVPLPSNPLISVSMSLDLHMSASGKAELVLKQVNGIGLEIKNGNPRFMKESTSSHNNRIKSTFEATTGIRFGLECATVQLMDASILAGGKATAKTIFHLYDEDGNHTTVQSDVNSDVADEVAEGNPDVLVCVDLDAYPVLKIKMNSSKSILGKMGFDGTITLLGTDNASVFHNSSGHFENFQLVAKCTRSNRTTTTKQSDLKVNEKISISSYNMIVSPGNAKDITILSLPSGYHLDDLFFESSDPSIASVDESGTVTGIGKGSTVITISTKDGNYSIQCNILVPSV